MATTPVTTTTPVTVTATYAGATRTATLTLNSPVALTAVTLAPASLVGAATSTGTVTLSSAAAPGGLVVTLTSSNPAATVPDTVTVAAGATSATFTTATTAVTAPTAVTITATAGGISRTATLTVNPAATEVLPAPSLLSPPDGAPFSPGQTIVFDWSDVGGAANYTIQIDDQENFSSPTINLGVPASRYATSTLPTTRMWFRVRAVDTAGVPGAWSPIRRFEVKT
ncbi:MAG TPA: hypothetical protein VE466_01665 [Acidimicrobiales bacterium]|nr:hypothetical protein [Acidimicrobiales bacterium]